MLKNGDSIGIISCSNGVSEKNKINITLLEKKLLSLDIKVIYAKTVYQKHSIFSGSSEEQAYELAKLYKNPKIKAIFDISGGDLANGILDYLDFDIIKENPKPFFGYSDLSVILNAIYTKTNVPSYHYQLRNLIGNYGNIQIANFKSTFLDNTTNDLLKFNYQWIQGFSMEGIVIGGNIRCFLKLAGTQYMPTFDNKILFLESMSGDVGKMCTYLTHYKQLGAFDSVNGILLGSFTEMERENYSPNIIEIIKNIVNDSNLPIAKTKHIGHGQDSKCLIIGKNLKL